MEVVELYDYVNESSQETGIDIGLVLEKDETEDIKSDFVPESFADRKENYRRVAVYVSWYTEFAYLFIEKRGVGIDELQELLSKLEENRMSSYEFQEIGLRVNNQVEIKSVGEGFEVIDRKSGLSFSTERTDNPRNLEDE